MTRLLFVVLIPILVYVYDTNSVPSKMLACPSKCYCAYSRSNWEADCSRNKLALIPYSELDRDTYKLNMSRNTLIDLQPFPADFKIRTLWLSENSIVSVEKESFAELKYLVDVNLANNNIKHIHPDAFE